MGACCSGGINSQGSDGNEMSNLKNGERIKILLLGPGDGGKSTIARRFKMKYGAQFDDKERDDYKAIVYSGLIDGIQKLIYRVEEIHEERKSDDGGDRDGRGIERCFEDRSVGEAAKSVLALSRGATNVDESIAANLQTCWRNDWVRNVFRNRQSLAFADSLEYFMNEIDRIATPSYVPTDRDILHVRKRTTGQVDGEYIIEGKRIRLFDLGGQRNERKKWVHTFERVNGIFFVASVADYCRTLFEDDEASALKESLDIFEEISGSEWFANAWIVVFLNKYDLLEEMLAKHPLEGTFPDYRGGSTPEMASRFIADQFKRRNANKSREMNVHTLSALDESSFDRAIEAVVSQLDHLNASTGRPL